MDESAVAGRLSVIGAIVVLLSGIAILVGGDQGGASVVMGAIGLVFLAAGAYVSRYGVPGDR